MAVDAIALVEIGRRRAHERTHSQPDGFDQRQQYEGGTHLVHRAVESEVPLDAELDVAAVIGRVDQPVEILQPLEPDIVDEMEGTLGRHRLERDTGGDQFVETVRIDIRHADAPVVEIFERAVGDQLVERAAHRHRAHGEAFGDAGNGHGMAGREMPGHDGFAQASVDPFLGRFPPELGFAQFRYPPGFRQ